MLHFKIVVLSSLKYFSHSDFKNSEFFVKEDELKSTSGDELKSTRTGGIYYNGSEVFEIFVSSSSCLERLRDNKIYFWLEKKQR